MSAQSMKICVFIITFGLLLIIPKEIVSQVAFSQVFPIGPDSVWNPSDAVLSQYPQDYIYKNLTSVMSETGASSKAIALAKMLEGKQYLNSFKKMGRVDLGTIVLPFANYADTEYVLVNGTPPFIKVLGFDGKIYGQKLQRDPLFQSLLKKYPRLMPMGRQEFLGMEPKPGGGQRFVFSEAFQEFRAGDIPARAHIVFDFDEQGNFLGASFLKLVRARR
jgi:hypothetical protein